ncbi:MAG: DUF4352 domain-containing protein [Candidatus Promineifilaceae bacterium]|nr:DUF4352 domain-containing protein [Candidatus Promineifilaceae bacterium]
MRARLRGREPLAAALLAAFVGLCLLCLFGVLLLEPQTPFAVDGDEAPTPFPTAEGGTTEEVIIAEVDGEAGISLPLPGPALVTIGPETFNVVPEPVGEDGVWSPEPAGDDVAFWLAGTWVNYVIALPEANNNRALLESLAPGDEIALTLRSDNQLRFTVTEREVVSVERIDLFAQNLPGITLFMLEGQGGERLVVRGTFVADPDAEIGAVGNVAQLGDTAQLDNLQLTATGASALFERTEAPPGFLFYLVDFVLQNVGTTPVDLESLRFVLVDELGNQYAANVQASQFGAFAPPSGLLQAGESRQASVGFQVPVGLSSPTLILIVTRADQAGELRVNIPFATADQAAAAVVTLERADVSADGTSLLLEGQIANTGEQGVVITEEDVTLFSNGTVHLMLSTNPALPWVVAPGQTLPFSLSFQRPAGSEAVLTILNQPFQLSGLR